MQARLKSFFTAISFSILFSGTVNAALVDLPRTGQELCYDGVGTVISCTGTGQDGDLRMGVVPSGPRFTDNGDGTVTDNLTGLIWLKDANCFGYAFWEASLAAANTLASGACDLTDGSSAGDWRMPNINELASLVNRKYELPAISNAAGDGQWTEGDPFTNLVQLDDPNSTDLPRQTGHVISREIGHNNLINREIFCHEEIEVHRRADSLCA